MRCHRSLLIVEELSTGCIDVATAALAHCKFGAGPFECAVKSFQTCLRGAPEVALLAQLVVGYEINLTGNVCR